MREYELDVRQLRSEFIPNCGPAISRVSQSICTRGEQWIHGGMTACCKGRDPLLVANAHSAPHRMMMSHITHSIATALQRVLFLSVHYSRSLHGGT